MIEKVCNLWMERADFRCIPTTGAVADGEAVMDSGVALEAAQKYPSLPLDLGRLLTSRGNHVHQIRPDVLSFPVKQYAWQPITIPVIARSVGELIALVGDAKTLLPRPVLGDRDPPWDQIAAAFASLPDNIVVIQHR